MLSDNLENGYQERKPSLTIHLGENRTLRLSHLSRRNSLHLAAERLLVREDQSQEDVSSLLAALADPSDRRWRERTIAAWALGRVSLTSKQQAIAAHRLGEVLADRSFGNSRDIFRLRRFVVRSLWGTVPCTIIMCIWCFRYLEEIRRASLPVQLFFLLGFSMALVMLATLLIAPVLLPLSIAVDSNRSNFARIAAANTLARLRLPKSIDAVAAASCDRNLRVRSAAISALPKILPEVGPEYYGQLAAETVPNLCRLLNRSNEACEIAILEALEKIGDGRAVEPVERAVVRGRTVQIRQAAEAILPILRERQRQEQAPQILLRPTGASSAPDTLLRAAQVLPDSQPEQLLRAGTPDQTRTE